MVKPIHKAAVTTQAVRLLRCKVTSRIGLGVQVRRGHGFREGGRFGSGAARGSGARGRPGPLRAQGVFLVTRLGFGGRGAGRGGHDMCGGNRYLTADWLERGAAAGTAEVT